MMSRALAASALLWLAGAAPDVLKPDFVFDGEDTPEEHFRLGAEIGALYRDAILDRQAVYQNTLSTVLNTARGQEAFAQLKATQQRKFPNYMKELEGVAHGAGLPVDTVLATALEEELSYFGTELTGRRLQSLHCSDIMMCTAESCFDAHNEDGDLPDHNLFFAHVRIGKANFTTLNYVGDLLGGMSAVAFNQHGLAFSLNWVGPAHCDTDGSGRNFVSRQLLEATTWDEAVATISQKHAAGHNYQLIDFRARRIANIEVANAQVAVKEISTPYFHVNEYQNLDVPGQGLNNSSDHRLARYAKLPPPQNAEEGLRIIGDGGDRFYPIFHDLESHYRGDMADWTLASALFDVDKSEIAVLSGNPGNHKVLRSFSMKASGEAPVLV